MKHKLMVFCTILVLLSLAMTPVGMAQAQSDAQDENPQCPRFDPSLMKDMDFLHTLPTECLKIYKSLSRETNTAVHAQSVGPMTVGGPDDFGYTYNGTVSYSWISASTKSTLAGDDEFSGPIDIGFNFPFYGMPQSQLFFNTNGLITFGAGSRDRSGADVPSDMDPNNYIAPYWDDLLVGNPNNTGAIYTSQGGSTPNRYFVVEWRNVAYWDNTGNITFEAILYENGDIVFQYQSLPSPHWPVVAIEDSAGYDGLPYSVYLNVPLNAIRFTYPAPAARVLVSPAYDAGTFASIGGHKDFNITISNSGNLGTDTYDLTMTSSWPITFYASNGVSPLADADADGVVDTGSLPQGTSTNVVARFSTPNGAQVGDSNVGVMQVTSSLNLSKSQTTAFDMSVPAGFADVFQENTDGRMSFMTVDSSQTSLSQVTTDNYFGYNLAVTNVTNRNYLYAWTKHFYNGSNSWTNIEYVLLNHSGNIILPITKLTDNSGTTMYTGDYDPSFAVAPNGTVGVAWVRYLENPSTNQANYNIYFATLNSSGNLLTGPTNLTTNTVWGTRSDSPQFYNSTIAASDDNRFIIGWEYQRPGMFVGTDHDVWYAVQSSNATSVLPPTALTIHGSIMEPILNNLTGGKVIMTWGDEIFGPHYAVIDSNGAISTPETSLLASGDTISTPDAVRLPNGKVALAWSSPAGPYGSPGIKMAVLDSSYNLLYGPTRAYNPWNLSNAMGECVSVTTDASNRVIMTWMGPENWLLYALGNDTGTFVTNPMIYKTSGNSVEIGCRGQGNAPYEAVTNSTPPTVTSIVRASANPTSAASVNFTVMFSEPVTGVAATDFALNATGTVSGATVQNVSGSGNLYTVTVAGTGYGTLRLDVPVTATIQDLAGNSLGSLPFVTGETYSLARNNGADTTGVFRPSNGLLYLKNKNDTGFADAALNYGLPGDYPVVGDWDGNGTVTIGIYRDGYFYLKNANTLGFAEVVFPFGQPGDQPIAGDWNGDGVDTIGVFHPSNGHFLLRNSNTEGPSEMDFFLGNPGDVGIAGDWDGDGKDTTGVFRPSNGLLYLKNKNESGFADAALNYGLPGDMPVTGDWDGDGIDTIGVYRQGQFMLRNENTNGFAEVIFGLGNPGDMPIAGNWDGLP